MSPGAGRPIGLRTFISWADRLADAGEFGCSPTALKRSTTVRKGQNPFVARGTRGRGITRSPSSPRPYYPSPSLLPPSRYIFPSALVRVVLCSSPRFRPVAENPFWWGLGTRYQRPLSPHREEHESSEPHALSPSTRAVRERRQISTSPPLLGEKLCPPVQSDSFSSPSHDVHVVRLHGRLACPLFSAVYQHLCIVGLEPCPYAREAAR